MRMAGGAGLEPHVTRQHDRVRASSLRPRDRATNRLDRMPEIKSTGKLRLKPKRHPRRGDTDDRDLDSSNLLQNERLNFCKRVLRIWKFRFSFHQHVRGKNGHV